MTTEAVGQTRAVRPVVFSAGQTPSEYVRGLAEVLAPTYRIKVDDVFGACREARMAEPRMIIAWKCREQRVWTLKEVGELLGDRDHSTIAHAVSKIDARRLVDRNIRATCDSLPDFVRGSLSLEELREQLVAVRATEARLLREIDEIEHPVVVYTRAVAS